MATTVRYLALSLVTLWLSACASGGGVKTTAYLKKGTIEIYRDKDNVCQTNTTPFFKVKKSEQANVEWKIIDDQTGCLDASDAVVEIRFDKNDPDPLGSCEKKNKRKIECPSAPAPNGPAQYEYTVWLGTSREDPVIQIEM